ncbi:glycosyltransferase family 2 protein [Nakamurella flavida]|uniref:Glycosyltransferase family 2 protein n=1 Tax=Nakamurella flavida TaxID=363630 RepID=A0A939C3Y2_9ACTN|nr:glycosyltransferase family 2 protein [Nakamurella flavida]MBM9475079.1 glycosyltransferase family 2 protein [Nakamurella flavida]MDP9776648.1 glycosyltransferase involved in cell wall biosynthesis [Nakamurella flavida]
MHVVHARPVRDPKVTIIVPARNEARNLEVMLPQLPSKAEIIVVDGHSVDDTPAVVARVRPDARLVQQTRRGKGNALAVGFAEATGDIIVMFDADGSADPLEIDRYVAALLAGADFAKGSRVLTGGGSVDITPIRDLGNKGLTLATNISFGTRYTDLCYGYNAFWRDILPHLALPSPQPVSSDMQWGDGFEIETLINCRVATANLLVTEVPSVELERIHGESNLHAVKDGLRVLKTIGTEWVRARRTPTRTASGVKLGRRSRRAATATATVSTPAFRTAAERPVIEEASA